MKKIVFEKMWRRIKKVQKKKYFQDLIIFWLRLSKANIN